MKIQSGAIETKTHYYEENEYCLQDVSNGTSINWELHVCNSDDIFYLMKRVKYISE